MMEIQEWGRKKCVECFQFLVQACLVTQIEVKNIVMVDRTVIIFFAAFLRFSKKYKTSLTYQGTGFYYECEILVPKLTLPFY
jgi:hypothetical protein